LDLVTTDQDNVTGGRAASAASPASTSADRMRVKRARDRAMAEAARRLMQGPADRAAAARQVGLPLGPAGDALEPIEPPRPGRQAGSVARHTAQWRDRMLAKYRSPLIVLAETYSRPTDELARDLGCSRADAFALQMKAADQLAPYLHSKMPTAVQLEGAPMVGVTIGVTEAKAAEIGLAQDGAFRIPKTLEHQAVSNEGNGDV